MDQKRAFAKRITADFYLGLVLAGVNTLILVGLFILLR